MSKKKTDEPTARLSIEAEVETAFDPEAHVPAHVEIRLRRREGLALKRYAESLTNRGERVPKFASDAVVSSPADAVRYMLNKMADQLEA